MPERPEITFVIDPILGPGSHPRTLASLTVNDDDLKQLLGEMDAFEHARDRNPHLRSWECGPDYPSGTLSVGTSREEDECRVALGDSDGCIVAAQRPDLDPNSMVLGDLRAIVNWSWKSPAIRWEWEEQVPGDPREPWEPREAGPLSKAEILYGRLFTAPDSAIPDVLAGLIATHPHSALDAIEEGVSFDVGGDGVFRRVEKSALSREMLTELLAHEDRSVRQRAVLLVDRLPYQRQREAGPVDESSRSIPRVAK